MKDFHLDIVIFKYNLWSVLKNENTPARKHFCQIKQLESLVRASWKSSLPLTLHLVETNTLNLPTEKMSWLLYHVYTASILDQSNAKLRTNIYPMLIYPVIIRNEYSILTRIFGNIGSRYSPEPHINTWIYSCSRKSH